MAFHFRLAARFRTTKDMDLGRWDDERAATEDLIAAQQVDLGDHFRFAVGGQQFVLDWNGPVSYTCVWFTWHT